MKKKDIKSYTLEELQNEMKNNQIPAFRGKQIYQWLHVKLVDLFSEMTNLPANWKEELAETYHITSLELVQLKKSADGDTSKFLFRLQDDNLVESVLMKYKHGNSVCISSQVGCRMGCRFCASTIDGLERNLQPSEMLDQIYQIQKLSGERVTHVLVMGTGEPLDNFDNLLRFLELLTNEEGLNISQRNVTVSTCGLVPKILELAKQKLQITLAISLHAPNDSIRKQIMPIANSFQIKELLEACQKYFETTGRRITFEYCMMRGVNDSENAARELATQIHTMNCHVNLIPMNAVKERKYLDSEISSIEKFKNVLEKNKINVTIRREMGADIDAACGQLRRSYAKKV